jgi:hypothetical protein
MLESSQKIKSEPIIIQSDHGPQGTAPTNSKKRFRHGKEGHIQMEVGTEKFKIFDAYYFPKKDYKQAGLHNSISPQKTFPIIFKTYFGIQIDTKAGMLKKSS